MSASASGVAVAALAALLPGVAGQRPAVADEAPQARICAEAEQRYQSILGHPPASADGAVVLMYKSSFCPPRLVVRAGQTVRWVNVDRRTSHSVWFKDAGRPDSERLFPADYTDMVIDLAPGEHRYVCAPHWNDGMVATIMVTR